MKQATKASPAQKALYEKWGKKLIDAGYTVIPNVIFQRQVKLGLDPLDINIILQLVAFWWTPGNLPHPSKATIAVATGVSESTVKRRIRKMQQGKLIKRVERRVPGAASKTNLYDLQGLIDAAIPLAEEALQKRAQRKKEDIELSGSKKPPLKLIK